MGSLLKICWSIESGKQNEEKTLRKLAYGRVFFEGLISGESRTLRKSEAFSKWLGLRKDSILISMWADDILILFFRQIL